MSSTEVLYVDGHNVFRITLVDPNHNFSSFEIDVVTAAFPQQQVAYISALAAAEHAITGSRAFLSANVAQAGKAVYWPFLVKEVNGMFCWAKLHGKVAADTSRNGMTRLGIAKHERRCERDMKERYWVRRRPSSMREVHLGVLVPHLHGGRKTCSRSMSRGAPGNSMVERNGRMKDESEEIVQGHAKEG